MKGHPRACTANESLLEAMSALAISTGDPETSQSVAQHSDDVLRALTPWGRSATIVKRDGADMTGGSSAAPGGHGSPARSVADPAIILAAAAGAAVTYLSLAFS